MILWLAACAPPAPSAPRETAAETGAETGGDSSAGTDSDSAAGAPRASLTSPVDADDLDPDAGVLHVALTPGPLTWTLRVDGEDHTLDAYAYNGQIPGPTLRAQVGDTVIVDVENDLDVDTTVHWHGLHVPFEVDGVPWMMDPIAPGESASYTFTVDTAGTFWYHPHFDSAAQVDLGLYGAFVVTDPDEPAADQDQVLILDDWDLPGDGTPDGEEPDHGMDGLSGVWTVNGQVDPQWTLPGGTTVRTRWINVSNLGYLDLSWPNMTRIAGDQGLLAAADTATHHVLSPGDRIEGIWAIGEDGFSVDDLGYSAAGATGQDAERLAVVVDAPAPAPAALDWPWSGAAPTDDPGTTDVRYALSGDTALGEWYINGEQWPDVTIQEIPRDLYAILEVRNISPTEHPFHLHGLPMEVLSLDGVAPEVRTVEDTVNIPIYGVLRARVLADLPGDWMAHCHLLPHAEGGMMTVLRVGDELR